MFDILYKYFIIHGKAVLPGIGVFHIHRQHASFDFSRKVFISPSGHIGFRQSEADVDKRFYVFASKEQQAGEAEAAKSFSDFTQSLQQNLQTNGRVELPGFGLISKDVAGTLQFKPEKPLPSFLKDVAAERTIREASNRQAVVVETERKDNELNEVAGEAEKVGSKSYWWIIAIILAIGAIAAIAYYYYQNGSLR